MDGVASLIKQAKADIKFLEGVPEAARGLVGDYDQKLASKKAALRDLDAQWRSVEFTTPRNRDCNAHIRMHQGRAHLFRNHHWRADA